MVEKLYPSWCEGEKRVIAVAKSNWGKKRVEFEVCKILAWSGWGW